MSRPRLTGHAHVDVTGLVLGLAGMAAETSTTVDHHHHHHCHHGCTGPCRHPSHRRGPRARPVVHHHHVHHAPPPVCVTTTPVVAVGCTPVAPPPPTGAYLRILSASYGCGQRRYDVTTVLQQLVFAQGGLSINAFGHRRSMNNQFGDPAHGSRKTLEFTYEIVGLPKTVVLKEDYKLNLALTAPGCHGAQEAQHFNLVLLQASYGFGESRYDVTSILANMIAQQGGKQVSAFGYLFSPNGSMNQAFGDPVPGVDKDLRVVYQWRTPVLSCAVHEDQPVRLAYEALRSPLC